MHCNRRSDRAGNHAAHRQPGAVSEYGGLRHVRARTAWRDHSLRVGQTPLEPKARIAVDRYGIPPSATVGFFDAPSGVHGTFFESVCAPQQIAPTDFRFGSKADIRACPINVRFTPSISSPRAKRSRVAVLPALRRTIEWDRARLPSPAATQREPAHRASRFYCHPT